MNLTVHNCSHDPKLKEELTRILEKSSLETKEAKQIVVDRWLKKFEGNQDQLDLIIKNYSNVIMLLCKEPINSIISRIKIWETRLFSHLEPVQAERWRKERWMQIAHFSTEEDINRQIEVTLKAIKRESDGQEVKFKEEKVYVAKKAVLANLHHYFKVVFFARRRFGGSARSEGGMVVFDQALDDPEQSHESQTSPRSWL
eukprot:TRINITY_DN12764_c0_g1_i1.p1 TRINITY_DN12764_c0_g1~~TRINITY_DN12764_c0_g1_i1.p1  ORF type:complete len:200 (+),score=41.88 TRINITY_DN12764_c0_g1_i1:1032-1631(+)